MLRHVRINRHETVPVGFLLREARTREGPTGPGTARLPLPGSGPGPPGPPQPRPGALVSLSAGAATADQAATAPLPLTRRPGRHSGYAGPPGQSARPRGPARRKARRPNQGPRRACVTGRTPHAVANQRAPRPVRADVGEPTRGPRARARGFPLPLARARGRRERKREEWRGEGRRGGAAAPRQVSRSAFHRERETEAAPASLPAAPGERLRPGPPVTRGGGLSAAPGLGPCRPLSA